MEEQGSHEKWQKKVAKSHVLVLEKIMADLQVVGWFKVQIIHTPQFDGFKFKSKVFPL